MLEGHLLADGGVYRYQKLIEKFAEFRSPFYLIDKECTLDNV